MNKVQFLNTMRSSLRGLPKEEIEDILYDYKEHIEVGITKGKTESLIIDEFGSPRKIAKKHKAEFYMGEAVREKTFKTVTRALMAGFGLGLLNLIFVFPIFISILSVFFSLFMTGIALLISGFAVAISPVFTFNPFPVAACITAGIALISLGLLIMIGSFFLTKGFVKITITYLKSNINLIKIKEVTYDED
ncbi:MAG: DUF1700 domain-containing protein [Clostridia bacterium]|nr:DUF1700 domain-containing protein [Clostridia bacterium]